MDLLIGVLIYIAVCMILDGIGETYAFFIQHKPLLFSFAYTVVFEILIDFFPSAVKGMPTPIPELASILYFFAILTALVYLSLFRFKYGQLSRNRECCFYGKDKAHAQSMIIFASALMGALQ